MRLASPAAAAAVLVTAVVSAAVVTSGAGDSAAVTRAAAGQAASAHLAAARPAVVSIRPIWSGSAGPRPRPPAKRFCERNFRIACYRPGQIRRAYRIPALLRRGIDGRGQTIVIADSFGSPPSAATCGYSTGPPGCPRRRRCG